MSSSQNLVTPFAASNSLVAPQVQSVNLSQPQAVTLSPQAAALSPMQSQQVAATSPFVASAGGVGSANMPDYSLLEIFQEMLLKFKWLQEMWR